jgi:hypothetical protein
MPPRSVAAIRLLPLLPLFLSGEAVAGPPDRASGRMVRDEVAVGLSRYRRETDDSRRVEWLRKLAPTRDPRVGLALGEYLSDRSNPLPHQISVAWMLTEHFMSSAGADDVVEQTKAARTWWEENGADLHRRARQLPQ